MMSRVLLIFEVQCFLPRVQDGNILKFFGRKTHFIICLGCAMPKRHLTCKARNLNISRRYLKTKSLFFWENTFWIFIPIAFGYSSMKCQTFFFLETFFFFFFFFSKKKQNTKTRKNYEICNDNVVISLLRAIVLANTDKLAYLHKLIKILYLQ